MTHAKPDYDLTLVNQKLRGLQGLTPAPATLIHLLQVIDDPDVSMGRLAAIVGADAPLTTQLLRLVNSASFGLARPVDNIPDALHFVGVAETKSLAIALALKTGLIGRAPVSRTLDRAACWRHCLASALAAYEMARRSGYEAPNTAYAAGLLHDLGLLALDLLYADELRQAHQSVIDQLRDSEERSAQVPPSQVGATAPGRLPPAFVDPREDAERRFLGFTHAEAGAWLGREWGLPRVILWAMLHHDHPWDAPGSEQLCAIVHVAERLAQRVAPTLTGARPIDPDPVAVELSGVAEPVLRAIAEYLPAQLEALRDLLELTEEARPVAARATRRGKAA